MSSGVGPRPMAPTRVVSTPWETWGRYPTFSISRMTS
jgi:hypothetical protein